MEWEQPSFIEINMSAEIGGYQEDGFDQRIPVPSHNVGAETAERPRAEQTALQPVSAP